MSNTLESRIAECFADVPRPADDELCSSNDEEALEETSPFVGKTWQELDAEVLASHADALRYWFTPAAFHYYFPAFLTAGLKKPRPNYVRDILLLLRPEEDEALATFTKERLQLLTQDQIDVFADWLRATFPRDDGELEDALKVIEIRYWW